MKIDSFHAEDVQGYLQYDIKFFEELTFLIGINGSGKTTALKLLLGILSPSYEYLNSITFKKVHLVCSSSRGKRDIEISATESEDPKIFRLSLRVAGQPEISNVIHRSPSKDEEGFDEDLTIEEKSRNQKFEILKVTSAIRKIATPKFLGLDRRVYEGRSIDNRMRNRRLLMHGRNASMPKNRSGAIALDSSLQDVQFLLYDYFRGIASRQPEIGNEFKRKIFSLSFEFIEDFNLTGIPANDSQVREKKEKVLRALENLDLAYLSNQADSFFDKMIKIVASHNELVEVKPDVDLEGSEKFERERYKLIRRWFNNSSQLKRIDGIILGSQKYQEDLARLREPIKRFESIISKFFIEGNKFISVEKTGEIKVLLKDGKKATVFELSSGEKQIIIMIAHLVFSEGEDSEGVFIIDEPELSLHIAWQEIFVDAVQEASPHTQFILATHSPSIIAKKEFKKLCQDISVSN